MLRLAPLAALVLLAHLTLVPVFAGDADRDFSGRWFLDSGSGERQLTITQSDSTIRCTATAADGSESEWKFALNGDDSKYPVGAESRNTAVKWEGSALLVNTLVTGPRDYTIMDRWRLSRDRATLTDESTLVYRREGAPSVTSDARPTLMTRPDADPRMPEEYVVPAGTHI